MAALVAPTRPASLALAAAILAAAGAVALVAGGGVGGDGPTPRAAAPSAPVGIGGAGAAGGWAAPPTGGSLLAELRELDLDPGAAAGRREGDWLVLYRKLARLDPSALAARAPRVVDEGAGVGERAALLRAAWETGGAAAETVASAALLAPPVTAHGAADASGAADVSGAADANREPTAEAVRRESVRELALRLAAADAPRDPLARELLARALWPERGEGMPAGARRRAAFALGTALASLPIGSGEGSDDVARARARAASEPDRDVAAALHAGLGGASSDDAGATSDAGR